MAIMTKTRMKMIIMMMRMRNDDDDAGGPATAASPRGDRGKTAGSGAPQAWRQVVKSLLCYFLLQLDVSSNNCEIIRAELVSGTEGIMCKQGQCSFQKRYQCLLMKCNKMVFCLKTLTKHFIIFAALDIIPGRSNYSDCITFMRGSLSFYLSVYGDERFLLISVIQEQRFLVREVYQEGAKKQLAKSVD